MSSKKVVKNIGAFRSRMRRHVVDNLNFDVLASRKTTKASFLLFEIIFCQKFHPSNFLVNLGFACCDFLSFFVELIHQELQYL